MRSDLSLKYAVLYLQPYSYVPCLVQTVLLAMVRVVFPGKLRGAHNPTLIRALTPSYTSRGEDCVVTFEWLFPHKHHTRTSATVELL